LCQEAFADYSQVIPGYQAKDKKVIEKRRFRMDDQNFDSAACCKIMEDALSSTMEPDEILKQCLNAIVESLNSERGFVMLYDSTLNELSVMAAHNVDPDSIFTTAEVSQTIINTVYYEAKPVMSSNALGDPRFAEKSSVVISGLRSILCVPMTTEKGLIGLIYVDNRMKIDAFQQGHLQFLQECANKFSQVVVKLFPDTRAKPRV
jgi:GAF domain-containing protein